MPAVAVAVMALLAVAELAVTVLAVHVLAVAVLAVAGLHVPVNCQAINGWSKTAKKGCVARLTVPASSLDGARLRRLIKSMLKKTAKTQSKPVLPRLTAKT